MDCSTVPPIAWRYVTSRGHQDHEYLETSNCPWYWPCSATKRLCLCPQQSSIHPARANASFCTPSASGHSSSSLQCTRFSSVHCRPPKSKGSAQPSANWPSTASFTRIMARQTCHGNQPARHYRLRNCRGDFINPISDTKSDRPSQHLSVRR